MKARKKRDECFLFESAEEADDSAFMSARSAGIGTLPAFLIGNERKKVKKSR